MVSDYKKKKKKKHPNWKLPGLMLGYFKKPGVFDEKCIVILLF